MSLHWNAQRGGRAAIAVYHGGLTLPQPFRPALLSSP
eukprot:CAMPEP_0174717026 /NCGR_PEP_ID=MMETSP1094-20130205/25647_1 /TAXON_ID=156173 /ORGANISM="Chrysochromulina brevifilum, Strain UTEX LB 985" /LENGTH=36 /DNA_ID= /DNA_START= /DNA_END= /DNA_ORIENTATION=